MFRLFKSIKPIMFTVVLLIFGVFAHAFAQTGPNASNTTYLPLVSAQVEPTPLPSPTPDGISFRPAWQDVSSTDRAAPQAANGPCGSDLPQETEAAGTNGGCLLPGNYPILNMVKNNQVTGNFLSVQNGSGSDNQQVWNMENWWQGAQTWDHPDFLQIESWKYLESGAPNMAQGTVHVHEHDYLPTVAAAGVLELPVVPAAQQRFVTDMVDYLSKYVVTTQLEASALQPFYAPVVPLLYKTFSFNCGLDAIDTSPIRVIGPTLLPTVAGASFMVKVQFLGYTDDFHSMSSCMGEYQYLKVADLMFRQEFEPFRVAMRAQGYTAWEDVPKWKLPQPVPIPPNVVYYASWVAEKGGSTIWTVEKFVDGVLSTASTFFIVPDEAWECFVQATYKTCKLHNVPNR